MTDDFDPKPGIFDRPVTRDRLGQLGGNAHFTPPNPDRAQQAMQGFPVTPRAKRAVVFWDWWFRW